MANMLFANNANTTLASSLTNSATTMSVVSASAFPTPTGSQYFYCTLADAATQTTIEIVKVTAVSGTTFTIVRGQDGTSGTAFASGAIVSLRLVRASLNDFPKLDEDNTFTGANAYGTPASIVLTNASGTASININGTVGATTPTTGAFTTITASSTIKGATTISVGNATPSASGAGITFPATQSASTDVNTLDDYEEGTWTPSIGGLATYAVQDGIYIKVGRIVTIQCKIEITLLLTGSTTTISGLPFASVQTPFSTSAQGAVGYFQVSAVSTTSLVPLIGNNSTQIIFSGSASSGTSTGIIPVALFQNGTRVDFSITYITAN